VSANTSGYNPKTFSASVEALLLGDIVFTLAEFSAQTFRHREKHTRLGAAEHLILELYLTGSGTDCLGEDFIAMSPSQINLFDYRQTLFTTVTDTTCIAFVIPRNLIRAPSIDYFPVQSWHTQSSEGRLLVSLMKEISTIALNSQQADGEALSHGLAGLLNGLMIPKLQRTVAEQDSVQACTLASMKDYIRANLHRPDLNAKTICKVFNCSRSTVYRCFKEEAGVEAYIKDQRLNRAFRQLSGAVPQNTKTPIYNIALASGFTDPAYFSRLFKQTFGITPSEVLYDNSTHSMATQELVDLDPACREHIDIFKDWMCQTR
jgi:AraC-like DNA-binding protein